MDNNTQMCHITVMKKILGVLGTFALVASVTPVAMAGNSDRDGAKDIAIDVKGTTLPASLGSLEYPYTAADRGLSGECEIQLQVAETGTASDHKVVSCSNAAFLRAAKSFAETLKFDPQDGGETHELLVSWSTY